MVPFSTPLSIKNEEISIFAVIETLGAIALSIALYINYETLLHIFIGAILAPFLLLRTKRSTEQALSWVEKSSSRLERLAASATPEISTHSKLLGWTILIYILIVVILLWITNIATIFLIKFGVTSYNLITNFVDSVSSIPDNWRRVVLYTDIFSYPEIVPGIEDYKGESNSILDLRTSQAFQDIYSETFLPPELKQQDRPGGAALTVYKEPYIITKATVTAEFLLRFWSILMALCIYIPAVIYRFSLKSTSLIWCPLFWAFRPIKPGDDAIDFAHGICIKTKYKLARVFSICIVASAITKIAVIGLGIGILERIDDVGIKSIVQNLFEPHRVPMWQVAALVNSVLTWWILFKAENFYYDLPRTVDSDKMLLFFRRTFLFRNFLTIYTCASLFYIAARASKTLDLSSIQILWFPW